MLRTPLPIWLGGDRASRRGKDGGWIPRREPGHYGGLSGEWRVRIVRTVVSGRSAMIRLGLMIEHVPISCRRRRERRAAAPNLAKSTFRRRIPGPQGADRPLRRSRRSAGPLAPAPPRPRRTGPRKARPGECRGHVSRGLVGHWCQTFPSRRYAAFGKAGGTCPHPGHPGIRLKVRAGCSLPRRESGPRSGRNAVTTGSTTC
jgi:hypothetical protein